MLTIGKDVETDEYAHLDASRSRAVLICGKRGSGKSYTLGVLVEELVESTDAIVVIIDPMGIYHTMCTPNTDQEQSLWNWGMQAEGKTVKLLVPGDAEHLYGGVEIVNAMQQRGVQFQMLQINPSDLTADSWCDLFDMTISEPMGMVLYRSVQSLHRRMKRTGDSFSIPELITEVDRDKRGTDKTKEAILLRLEMAMDWGFFATEYQPIFERFDRQTINVIDLSVIDPGRYGLRNLIVDVVCSDLFRKRIVERRREELNMPTEIPQIWLAIDEAHQFAPTGSSSLSKETLIRWVKEGRQPGLSLIVSSQQPAAIDKEILSQCDVIFAHKITAMEDMHALNQLSHDYMSSELRSFIRRINGSGAAVFVDDEGESVKMVQIRPRNSKHGGGESESTKTHPFRI